MKKPLKNKSASTTKRPNKKVSKKISKKSAVLGIIIVILALGLFVVSTLLIYPAVYNNIRRERILDIYTSLHLSDTTYILQSSNVFGDKRVYSWDKSRSFSSERDYIRAADVKTTTAELNTAITAAGFKFFEERYPGSAESTPTYKSANGEYIRVSVSSKPRDDAFQNAALAGKDVGSAINNMDINAAPSNVVIKVNLDDDNE